MQYIVESLVLKNGKVGEVNGRIPVVKNEEVDVVYSRIPSGEEWEGR